MEKNKLELYAKLIAKTGVNVQRGQDVIIRTELNQVDFVEMLVKSCYELGAREVVVNWNSQDIDRLHYKYRDKEVLAKVKKWEEERLKYYVDTLPCRIILESEDPDGLKGIDQEKYAYARQQQFKVIKPYRDQMENKHQWCIAAVPGEKWAKKLFPDLSSEDAIEKLWETILFTSRVTENPFQAWEEHNEEIKKHCNYLNNLGIESFHYQASNGTDFTVGLIEQGVFAGGMEKSISGITFNPNIPSEECFTSPKKGCAEGIVYATKPLSYQGELIEDFYIRFQNGKAVQWNAKKGQELLTKLLTFDEGASYLGECALVPYSSPINQTNILFYNTLFDENATCHLALGEGFPDCIKDFEKKSLEEVHSLGINESMIHVDFMIGTKDLNITAKCFDGREVPIFINGTWA